VVERLDVRFATRVAARLLAPEAGRAASAEQLGAGDLQAELLAQILRTILGDRDRAVLEFQHRTRREAAEPDHRDRQIHYVALLHVPIWPQRKVDDLAGGDIAREINPRLENPAIVADD